MAALFTIGTTAGYAGVLRQGRKVVFHCGHRHTNRDMSTDANGRSARDCITHLVGSVRSELMADWYRNQVRRNTEDAIRLHYATETTAAAWRAKMQDELAQFDANRARLAEILGDQPVFGYNNTVVAAPPAPESHCSACGQTVRPIRWIPNYAGTGQPQWRDWRTVLTREGQDYGLCSGGGDYSYSHDEFVLWNGE